MTAIGHLHDGVILLLRPESFSFFLSYSNLVTIPVRFQWQKPKFAQESKPLKDSSCSSKMMSSYKWTIGSFCNGDGEQQKKNNSFRLAKNQLCTCITLFCTFLSHCCTTATWNFLFHSPALWRSRWAQHKKFLFLLRNLDTVLLDLTQKISPTFGKLNEIE